MFDFYWAGQTVEEHNAAGIRKAAALLREGWQVCAPFIVAHLELQHRSAVSALYIFKCVAEYARLNLFKRMQAWGGLFRHCAAFYGHVAVAFIRPSILVFFC